MKKTLKYFLIALIGFVFHYMFWIFTKGDCLAIKLSSGFEEDVILWLIWLTIKSLIAMFLLRMISKRIPKFKNTLRNKIILGSIVTLFIFGNETARYLNRIINTIPGKYQFVEKLCEKIKPANMLAHGTHAENLNLKEYNTIRKETWFPKIPHGAFGISYLYTYDGFLPDYIFDLHYRVPLNTRIDSIQEASGDFSKKQTFGIEDGYKYVTYSEDNH